jgi:hypothetical protein
LCRRIAKEFYEREVRKEEARVERQRDRERNRDRDRERETERETEIDRERERQTERQREKDIPTSFATLDGSMRTPSTRVSWWSLVKVREEGSLVKVRRHSPILQRVQREGLPILLLQEVDVEDHAIILPKFFTSSTWSTNKVTEDRESKLLEMRSLQDDPLQMWDDPFSSSEI